MPVPGVPGLHRVVRLVSGEPELLEALMHTVDRCAMLRAHVTAALSTARARQAGSADPDQFVEVVELLTMALQEDDRFTQVNHGE